MSARLTSFVIWAAVAASAVFWLLRLVSSSPAAPAHTVAVAASTTPRGDLTRVLGAPPVAATTAAAAMPEPALASRFKLLGVAAPRQGGDQIGLALIAVDGKPARGFKVGAPIDGELVLQSVSQRGASLGSQGEKARVTLELPPLPTAATSSRPPGAAGPVAVPPPGAGGFPGVGALPGSGPIGTLPQPVQSVPPQTETQEPAPIPVPPPPQQPFSSTR
jgi:general secretion pathway protein C